MTDSREELFDSSLNTINVSVNTELPMDFSYGPKGEEFDFLHFYGEMGDDDFHRMMSVDDLTYVVHLQDRLLSCQLCPTFPPGWKENGYRSLNGVVYSG